MTRLRFLVVLLPVSLLAAACGPKVPLNLSMRQVGIDVKGAQPPPKVLPAPDAVPGRVVRPPLPLPSLPSTFNPPDLFACPKASVFAVPKLQADATIQALPAEAKYPYRGKGKFSNGGAIPLELDYLPIGLRAVVRGSVAKGYDFVVAEQSPPAKKSVAFKLMPPSGPLQGGLYIVAMQWEEPVVGKIDFRPLQPMQFLPLPIQPGQTFAAAGVDPDSRVAMSLRGEVTGRKRVDACGSLIDTWEVKLSETITSPDGQLTIDATHDIATQYGGLSVQDEVVFSGVRNNALSPQPSGTLRSTISQLPSKAG